MGNPVPMPTFFENLCYDGKLLDDGELTPSRFNQKEVSFLSEKLLQDTGFKGVGMLGRWVGG